MTKKNTTKALTTKGLKKIVKKVTIKDAVPSTVVEVATFSSVLAEAKQVPVLRGGWNLAAAMEHLVKVDQKFAYIIGVNGIPEALLPPDKLKAEGAINPFPLPTGSSEEYYFSLMKIIIYQQLAASAAEPILKRFISTFGDSTGAIQPSLVKNAKFETVMIDGKRKILVNGIVSGLSEGKAKYIVDLTEHFLDPAKLKGVNLSALSDSELRAKLLAVKGLGPWSVDMFMMFDLQRANVLPVGDLVVRRGIAQFLGLPVKHFDIAKNMLTIDTLCASWAPYSSLAAFYMWTVVKKSSSVLR